MLIQKEPHDRATIVRFRDGDTVEVHIQCGQCNIIHQETIRLPNVESWEPSGTTKPKALATANTLTERYRGMQCTVSKHRTRRDIYGRRITDLLIDGESLQQKIVNAGLAWFGVGEPEPTNAHSVVKTIF